LNEVFVSGLPGLVYRPISSSTVGHVVFSTHVLWSAVLVPLVCAT